MGIPIIQKDIIYKKSIFLLKSTYVCEIIERDSEIKDYEYDVGKVILLIGKIFLSITRIENIGISMLGASKSLCFTL